MVCADHVDYILDVLCVVFHAVELQGPQWGYLLVLVDHEVWSYGTCDINIFQLMHDGKKARK